MPIQMKSLSHSLEINNMDILISTPTGTINQDDLEAPLPDYKFREAWRLNGRIIEIDQPTAKAIVCGMIMVKATELCAAGVSRNGNDFGYLDGVDRDLKVSILSQLSDGEINPHAGYIKDLAGDKVTLDDSEAMALLKALRSYVPQVVQAAHTAKDDLTETDVELFDVDLDVPWPSNVFLP